MSTIILGIFINHRILRAESLILSLLREVTAEILHNIFCACTKGVMISVSLGQQFILQSRLAHLHGF